MDIHTDFTKHEIFKNAYWKRPASEHQGDANPRKIYEDVGFSLTSWELMEEALAELYLILAGASKVSTDPVRRAFGSIESNSGRRKAIDAAAEAYLGELWNDKAIKSAFLILTRTIGEASGRRNDIAHGIVLGQVMDGVNYGSFLFPPDYNTLRTNLYADKDGGDPLYHTMTKYRFTANQVRKFGFKFKELQDAVRFYSGLLNDPEVFVRAVRGVDMFGGKLHGR